MDNVASAIMAVTIFSYFFLFFVEIFFIPQFPRKCTKIALPSATKRKIFFYFLASFSVCTHHMGGIPFRGNAIKIDGKSSFLVDNHFLFFIEKLYTVKQYIVPGTI